MGRCNKLEKEFQHSLLLIKRESILRKKLNNKLNHELGEILLGQLYFKTLYLKELNSYGQV